MPKNLGRMDDISAYFDVTPETVRNWIRTKGLPGRKIGRQWRFDWEEIKIWEEGQPSGSEAVPRKMYKDYVTAEHALSVDRVFEPDVVKKRFHLINGDCLDAMSTIKNSSVDLLLTDPPYNLGLFMQNRATNLKRMRENYFGAAGWDNLDAEQWAASMDSFFGEAARVLRKGAAAIVFMAVIKLETLISIAQKHGFYYKTTGAWHKLNPMPRNMNLHFINSMESWVYFVFGERTGTFNNNGKALHDFYETAVTSKGEKAYGKHPTQKPVELMEYFVRTLSNQNDEILDPFMGSGSTGIASKNLNRHFTGIELSKEYFNIAKKRMGAKE